MHGMGKQAGQGELPLKGREQKVLGPSLSVVHDSQIGGWFFEKERGLRSPCLSFARMLHFQVGKLTSLCFHWEGCVCVRGKANVVATLDVQSCLLPNSCRAGFSTWGGGAAGQQGEATTGEGKPALV